MKYLLDASAWITHLRQTSPNVSARLRIEPVSNIVFCSIVVEELQFGVWRGASARRSANLALVLRVRQQYVSLLLTTLLPKNVPRFEPI